MSLLAAIQAGDAPALERAIAEGADLDAFDPVTGLTPLARAAELGRTDLVRRLLDAGADTEASSVTHPVEAAVAGGHREVTNLLLEAGADPDHQGEDGLTPLMAAASRGDVRLVDRLLEAGADPARQTVDGETARDLAERCGHREIARHLRDGTDPTS